MRVLTEIIGGIISASRELETVPLIIYLAAAVLAAAALFLYGAVLPGCRMKSDTKDRLRRYCICFIAVIYVGIVMAVIFLGAQAGSEYKVQLVPFASLRLSGQEGTGLSGDLISLLVMVPLGMIAAWHEKEKNSRGLWKGIVAALVLSLVIEWAQLFGRFGIFDIDDILFNTLGGFLGAGLVILWREAFKKRSAGRIILRIVLLLPVILVLCTGGVFGAYHILRVRGGQELRENASSVSMAMESRGKDTARISEPGVVWHNGKAYRYNEDIITILCMGVDQSGEVLGSETGFSGQSGQADTIFMAVLNEADNQLTIIAVSRDTMTEIPVFDAKGGYIGENINHLGLAYAFGDGRETSCQYMVDAVSKLFYGIPINGYAAVNMSAIAVLNDAVGGVTVTVPEDFEDAGPEYKKGEPLHLDGSQAESFVRWRNSEEDGSNNQRISRQKQYLTEFIKTASKAVQEDYTLPVELYQGLSAQMVTDLNLDKAVYLATEALDMEFKEENLITLQGKAAKGNVYDEFYADDDALYELILDTFYVEVQK